MRAKSVEFKRGIDSKKALNVGLGLMGELHRLMDEDTEGVIMAIEKYSITRLIIEGYAPGYKHPMPKVYINRLIKKIGLDKYIKAEKTYIPDIHSAIHYHRFKIRDEYLGEFPDDFRISIWDDDRYKE